MTRELKDLADLQRFADDFLMQYPGGLCVGLVGDLGSGKTTFVRACIEAITQRAGQPVPRVVSPSFVIQQSYSTLIPPVEHFDLYRLENLTFEGLVDMGFFEAASRCRDKQGFVFVEWPERASANWLHLDCRIRFEIAADAQRRVAMLPPPT